MTLILRAMALNDSPLTHPISARFGPEGGSIGRADTNSLALPDPQRHISRVQAEVRWRDGVPLLANVGGPNPVSIDGRALAPGSSFPLKPGAVLLVGGYRLSVEWQDEAASVQRKDPVAGGGGPLTILGLGDSDAHAVGADPFSILLPSRKGTPPVATPQGTAKARKGGVVPPATPSRELKAAAEDPFADLGLDDFLPPPAGVDPGSPAFAKVTPKLDAASHPPDPFGESVAETGQTDPLSRSSKPAAVRAAAQGLSVFGDLIDAPAQAKAVNQLIADLPGNAVQGDPLGDFLSNAPPSKAEPSRPTPALSDRIEPWEELVDFSATKPRKLQSKEIARDRLALPAQATGAAITPARPVRRSSDVPVPRPNSPSPADMPKNVSAPVRPRPAGVAASAPSSGSQEAQVSPSGAWIAFCEGAGIDPALGQPTRDQFRQLGAMVRASALGLHALVKMRQHAKQELGSAVTQIRAKNNNPLKFSVDGLAALEQMVRPAARGFMPGPEAISEACDDVLAHAIGTVAGMQAALKGVLDRFEPTALESKLTHRSLLDNLVPGARKARLWELYVQHAASLREEASEDFETLFGKAFRKAYEAQIDRIHDERKA